MSNYLRVLQIGHDKWKVDKFTDGESYIENNHTVNIVKSSILITSDKISVTKFLKERAQAYINNGFYIIWRSDVGSEIEPFI